MTPGTNLSTCVEHSRHLKQVFKSDLRMGDWMIVRTLNSIYSIRVIGEKQYSVTGGWFDRKGRSPMTTTITGCSWGGSIIKLDVAAACGLCLEFGNRLITTPIQTIVVIPYANHN